MNDPFLELAEQNIHRLNAERDRLASAQWQHDLRWWKILMLSPTLEICEAMLRGEAVPIDRLDPVWVERFGLRDQEAA